MVGSFGINLKSVMVSRLLMTCYFYASVYPDENRPVGLGVVFEDAVKRNPSGFAVIGDDRYYTYTEFNKWSNRIANYFLSKGFKKGDSVAIFMEDSPELLAVILGLNKIGVVCAMINTSQRKNVLVHSINLAKARLAIVGGELAEAYAEVKDELKIENNTAYWLTKGNSLVAPGNAPELNLPPTMMAPAPASTEPQHTARAVE